MRTLVFGVLGLPTGKALIGGQAMNTDLITTLGPDTQSWLAAVVSVPGLSPTHYRILFVLREINCSPSVLASITGLKGPRCRQRLRELEGKGLVRVQEVLSDRTQIWGLVEDIAKADVQSYPTEAVIQERRGKVQYGAPVIDPTVRRVWKNGKPKGERSIVDVLDIDILKRYEAKHET